MVIKKYLCFFGFIVLFAGGCANKSILSFHSKPQQVIAIQPLDSFDTAGIHRLAAEISVLFRKKVIVFDPIPLSDNFFNKMVEQTDADSVIRLLSKRAGDTVAEVIGLTNKALFTLREAKGFKYFDENIFGMGYQPGNSCVVSDSRFRTESPEKYHQILKNVIIHEMGHNMGLGHCTDENCIMSEKKGINHALYRLQTDYCSRCREALNSK